MHKPSKETVYLTMAFAAIAGVGATYTYWEDVSYALVDILGNHYNDGEVRLTDNEGSLYTLIHHDDGKETALFDDDKTSVTFHRDEDGSLVWDAGLAGLLPNIAPGYYVFYGYDAPTAQMDLKTMTYKVSSPLSPREGGVQLENMHVSQSLYALGLLRTNISDRYHWNSSRRAPLIGSRLGFGSKELRRSGYMRYGG